MQPYSYIKEICLERLINEIRESTIVIALDTNQTNILGNQVNIYFKEDLSEGNKTLLDGIVEAHVPTPMPIIPNEVVVTEQPVTISAPFAEPLYRTKMDATSEVVTIAVTNNPEVPYIEAVTDFLLTEEYYVSGGELGATNVQMGDYITAEVHDRDGVIPAPYRVALCENWPTVAKYIKKNWMILKTVSTNASIKIDTRPLTAKVTAGLYLRVTYYAKNTGSNRQIVMNYDLTKKL